MTDAPSLLKLMAWLSPSFPVGGFTYSHGLEWAIEDGTVTGADDLARWLADVLAEGAGRNDAILFVAAHRLAEARAWSDLSDLVHLSAALAPSRERHLEATAQGAAFVKAVTDSYPAPALAAMTDALGKVPWTYAVAVAAAATCHGIPARPALLAYLQAFAAAIVSAGVRAIPLGQTDGLRLVAALTPVFDALAETAFSASLDDLGGAAMRADIASIRHETQYTRLFRS